MLKKRLVGVITVRDGWVVQSIGYRRYLPVGHPAIVVENLDRWGVDEILVLSIDRSIQGLGPDMKLLEALRKISLSTPLTYGGGIQNVKQASIAVNYGVERICIDAALHGDFGALREISLHIGSQALVAAFPLSLKDGGLVCYDYIARRERENSGTLAQIVEHGLISEVLVIDWQHEGICNGFDLDLLRLFPFNVPLIAFGGLSETAQIEAALAIPQVVAIGIGNFLNYKEHAVQGFKERLSSDLLRAPIYQGMTY